jgi:hypothetical protein
MVPRQRAAERTDRRSILLKHLWRKFIGPFREFGLMAGLLYALDRLLSRLSPRLHLQVYELMVQPIMDKPLLPGRFNSQMEIREIKAGDPEIKLMPVRPEVMQARLAQAATCLGAFSKGKFVGYMWFCNKAYEEDEVRCTYLLDPVDESVFDFDFYLFPEHRMGLGFAGLWNGANAFLRNRGIRYTFSRLTRFNVASRRAHQHLGWKVVGRVVFFVAWKLEIMFATLFPYFHVSMAKGSRVQLTLLPDVLHGAT